MFVDFFPFIHQKPYWASFSHETLSFNHYLYLGSAYQGLLLPLTHKLLKYFSSVVDVDKGLSG